MDNKDNLGCLKCIKIEGFKSISSLSIDIAPLNIIVGPNGAGKSNFVGIFDLLYNIGSKQLQKYIAINGGANRFLHFGSKNTNKISIQLDFSINRYICNLVYAVGNKFIFEKEEGCVQGRYVPKCNEFTKFGEDESSLNPTSYAISGYIKTYLNGLKKYHFHDTTKESPLKQSSNKRDNLQLRGNGSNLAAMLYKYKNSEKYQYQYNQIVNTIRLVAPFFEDFILEPDENDNIILAWKHKDSDAHFDCFDFSDGTLRFIALATLLLQPEEFIPQTILIDEPELGLHPYALKILAELFKNVVAYGKQIIATSQSVSFINEFSYEDIIVADRINGQSTFRRLNKKEVKNWLDEFSMGDIWARNIIGGMPNDF